MSKKLRDIAPPPKNKKEDKYISFFAGLRPEESPDYKEPKKEKKLKEDSESGYIKTNSQEIAEMHPLLKHPFTGDTDHVQDDTHVSEMHHWLGNQMNFSDDHIKAIKNYTRSSKAMNRSLIRNNGDLSRIREPLARVGHKKEDIDRVEEVGNSLSQAIQAHQTNHDMHVYTGVGFDPETHFTRSDDGGPMSGKMPAFTSTSLDPVNGRFFGMNDPSRPGHMISIHVPAGSHGIYTAHHSNFPTEREFILHPNARLHIHPEPTIQNYTHGTGPTAGTFINKIWHARLVHDGFNPTSNMPEGEQ